MNSPSIGHETADPVLTSAGPPRASPVPVSTDATARASTGGDAPASSQDDQNPLWLIAAAMAIFFVVAAAVMAAG
jgi:hypothetical protein